jgi:hypothetical protein
MEVSELASILETVPSQGIFVSQIERLRISCSLRLLQNQMKAESVYFLGKVLTLGNDYYLAFSTEVNNWMPRVYFCSQDAITWFSVACGDRETLEEAIHDRTPFTGVLTSEIILPSGRVVNEEIRLSALLSDLSEHCLLVPRGFLLKTALGLVLPNPTWSGLSVEDCRKASNLRHWRQRAVEQTLLEKSLGNPALDFVEPLSDLSEWGFVFADEGIHFKSLRWPGFEFYLNDSTFANLYFGHGIPETNLAEVLAPISPPEDRHLLIKSEAFPEKKKPAAPVDRAE